jgi:hypothetical protein
MAGGTQREHGRAGSCLLRQQHSRRACQPTAPRSAAAAQLMGRTTQVVGEPVNHTSRLLARPTCLPAYHALVSAQSEPDTLLKQLGRSSVPPTL